ncbi:MAG: DNA polymerase III subunit beta [Gammaproteobacteria bacterium]|nr:DNA polymerase III subunit beta [Gammaproteobacteria bacterium]
MKILINRNLLQANLQVVQKAMLARSNMPALTGILFNVKENEIFLTTSNMELAIRTKIENADFKVERTGDCLIPGKLFVDVVRKLNGEEVSLELLQDNILRIQSGTSDITMNLLDVTDYPSQNFDLNDKPIVVQADELKEIIRQTTFATSIVDNKPILTGVNLRVYGNKILAVATDSFRLSRRFSTLDEDYPELNIIIPAKSLNDLAKTIEEDEDEVNIYLDKGKISFEFSNIIFQSRLLEGNYPDTTKLIPTNFPIIIKFNKSELIDSIDRVSTMSQSGNATSIVKLNIASDGTVNLSSNSPELGTITDVIAPSEIVSMNEIKLSFSAQYFLDAVRAFNSQEVSIKITGEGRPFIFEAEDDPGLVELVLPLKS